MAILNDKTAAIDWDFFRQNIRKATPVDLNESPSDKAERIKKLEADPEAWKRYYFGKFFTYESPAFHKVASKRLLKNFEKLRHWYEVRHWVRGLSKTTTTMMDVLHLVLTGKLKNIIYTSSTWDAAVGFLNKYQAQLDSNQRIINDYGKQELAGSWREGDFTTRNGAKFLALGAGQSPRGNGNEEIRPDCIIVDDFDTDEECLNIEIINKKWHWFETALFFTVDVAKPYLIIWLGNIIAPDCCVVRAGKMADHTEIINIRDAKGKSVWPEKNKEEDIDYQLSKVSYESGQQEMFNNPMRQGTTFKEMTWGKCPPLKQLKFAMSYADPSTSNKDRPTLRSKLQNSCKVVVLMGQHNGKYYVYKAFVDNTTQANFIDWLYAMRQYVNGSTPLYSMIENNTLQDPIYQQILKPLIYSKRKQYGTALSVTPDETRKGDKWTRVESDLEPDVRLGNLILNEDEKENPHMKRLESQFLNAHPNSKELGGPDAVQGGKAMIDKKTNALTPDNFKTGSRQPNSKRF